MVRNYRLAGTTPAPPTIRAIQFAIRHELRTDCRREEPGGAGPFEPPRRHRHLQAVCPQQAVEHNRPPTPRDRRSVFRGDWSLRGRAQSTNLIFLPQKTSKDANGWYGEVEIPIADLELAPAATRTMGMTFYRRIPHAREEAFAPLIPSKFSEGSMHFSLARKYQFDGLAAK